MNALKFRMVTGMIAFTMARLANENKAPKYLKDRQYLTFENAVQDQELILALYEQTQMKFPKRHQEAYLAAVIIDETQYIILGSYKEWKSFYEMRWEYLMSDCPLVISPN